MPGLYKVFLSKQPTLMRAVSEPKLRKLGSATVPARRLVQRRRAGRHNRSAEQEAPMSVVAASAVAAASHAALGASAPTAWWAAGFWTSEIAKGVPAAIVALIIGLAAAAIAARQAQVASAKLKLELFEKRYAIYLAVWRAVSAPGSDVAHLEEEVTGIANLPSQTAFLCGVDLGHYVREIRDKLARYAETGPIAKTLYESPADGEVRKTERVQLRAWFATQAAAECHERFKPFLDFSNWK